MTERARALLEEVLRLSHEDKQDFILRLLEDTGEAVIPLSADSSIEDAWREEVRRRRVEAQRDQSRLVPLEDTLRRLSERHAD